MTYVSKQAKLYTCGNQNILSTGTITAGLACHHTAQEYIKLEQQFFTLPSPLTVVFPPPKKCEGSLQRDVQPSFKLCFASESFTASISFMMVHQFFQGCKL